MARIKLYTYFRSSAAYRVRIALHLKNLPFESVFVDLLDDGGEHLKQDYLQHNPQGLVPTLIDGGTALTQSLAIIEYLDETYPVPALLPSDPENRGYLRSLSQIVSSDIHPLNNLRVLNYLKNALIQGEDTYLLWYRHWIDEGFRALEEILSNHRSNGRFCWGQSPTIADLCLVPQCYNAVRFECDLKLYPLIWSIYQHCIALEAFQRAAPDNQPDSSAYKADAVALASGVFPA